MGCSNSVGAEVTTSPRSKSSRAESEMQDSVHSLTETIHQIQNNQVVAQKKVTQSSLGFLTIPEETLLDALSSGPPNEEKFSSGLVYKGVDDVSSDPAKLFNIIKRGEKEQFKEFVRHHFRDRETQLHSLRGMWESSPLHVAVQYGQYEIASILLDNPPEDIEELNRRNEKGCTVAVYVVMDGQVDFLKRLISMGVKLNIDPSNESIYNQKYDQSMIATPLSMAIINNHRRILGLLIDNGCNVDQIFTFPTVKSIRKSFGTANSASKNTGVVGMRPILLACAYGHDDIVRELVWRACDFHVTDDEKSNILHHLARSKTDVSEIFKFLQSESCVDDVLLNGIDENGDSPLHLACDLKAKEVATLLLDDGADASKLNPLSGFTPLHIAIRRRDADMVNLLLQYGANPLRRDEKENSTAVNKLTPLEMASKLPPESEIGAAVNQAAMAWGKMRVPMLRKSIINLFPDAQPSETIAMPHVQESVVHMGQLSPAKSVGSPRPVEPVGGGMSTSATVNSTGNDNDVVRLAQSNKVPFANVDTTNVLATAEKVEETEVPVVLDQNEDDCVQEFVPLDDSFVQEEVMKQEGQGKEEDPVNNDVALPQSNGIVEEKLSSEITSSNIQDMKEVSTLKTMENQAEINGFDNAETPRTEDEFHEALAAVDKMVQDLFNNDESRPVRPVSGAAEQAATNSQKKTSSFFRPVPPPQKSATPTSIKAGGSVKSSKGKSISVSSSGGTGNLRRASLKKKA